MARGAALQPGVKRRHSLTAFRRNDQRLQIRIDLERIGEAKADVEVEMRQKIGLVQQQQVGRREHFRIFERLVLALRHGEHDDLMRFAEIKSGRTNEIADIFDEQQPAACKLQLVKAMADHMRVEMAALAGVDLDRRRARGANALRVVRRLLIALDDGDREPIFQFADRADQQRCLSRSRARHEIQRESPRLRQTRAVLGGVAIVLGKNVAFDFDDAVLGEPGDVNASRPRAEINCGRRVFMRRMIVPMPRAMSVTVIVRVIVGMRVIVVVGVRVIVGVVVVMRMAMSPLMRMAVLYFKTRFSLDARRSATADCAHHSTSNSFTRMSSPDVTCT